MPSRRTVSAKESIRGLCGPQERGARNLRRIPRARFTFRMELLLSRVFELPRVLDHREGRDVDVHELAIPLLQLTDVDVLDDLALLRIDREDAPRAAQRLALEEI